MVKTTMRIYVEGKRLPIQVQFKGPFKAAGDEIARLLPKLEGRGRRKR
jgi:hypothetical protein